MISRRSAVVAALILIPILAYGVVGAYALWRTGLLAWVWLAGPVCWAVAWGLARYWKLGHETVVPRELEPQGYWTPRDLAAVDVVRGFQQQADRFTPQELADLSLLQRQARALAEALARHYHPGAADPIASLTVPELLAAVRLAVEDVERWLLSSVPGSRLLTIAQWRSLGQAPKWISRFQNTAWIVSILMNPANLLRYLSSQLTVGPAVTAMQTELLAAVYMEFIQRAGFYLIEMYSGRLRGGADAYRSGLAERIRSLDLAASAVSSPALEHASSSAALTPGAPGIAAEPVTIALVGQVSAGKSSLINALTGRRQAAVDILPETKEVKRYQMSLGESGLTVTLLDTPGYGDVGATPSELRQIRHALREAHVVLLVMDAHSPAREADRKTLLELDAWYREQPHLKPPPKLGVLTHVDLLKPTLEWSPPYDWREPERPKEQSLHDAVEYARSLFGGALAEVAPVCTDERPERAWGVLEEVVPALTMLLPDAQSMALLRAFEQELDRDRFKIVLKQFQRLGSSLWRAWVDQRLKPK